MIKYFKSAHEIAESESWDESRAQELINDMSSEYKKYLEKKRKISGGNLINYPVDCICEFTPKVSGEGFMTGRVRPHILDFPMSEHMGKMAEECEAVRPLIFDPEHYAEDLEAFNRSSIQIAELLSEGEKYSGFPPDAHLKV